MKKRNGIEGIQLTKREAKTLKDLSEIFGCDRQTMFNALVTHILRKMEGENE